MFSRVLILATAAALTVLPGRADAAKVVGKVVVTETFRKSLADAEQKPSTGAKPGYWNEPNAIRNVELPQVAPDSDVGLVLLREGAPAPKPDQPVEANLRVGALEKNVIVVRPGTTVKFRSIDRFDHELYVPNVDWFPPEKQSRGAFRMIDFEKEGVFEIRCRLVPHLKAWVVVIPATHVLVADAGGAFSLDGLPLGKYTFRAFHGGVWLPEKTFEIVKERDEISLEARFEAGATPEEKAAAPAAPAAAKQGENGSKQPENR